MGRNVVDISNLSGGGEGGRAVSPVLSPHLWVSPVTARLSGHASGPIPVALSLICPVAAFGKGSQRDPGVLQNSRLLPSWPIGSKIDNSRVVSGVNGNRTTHIYGCVSQRGSRADGDLR